MDGVLVLIPLNKVWKIKHWFILGREGRVHPTAPSHVLNHALGGRERKGHSFQTWNPFSSGLHDWEPGVWQGWQRPLFLSSQVFWDKKIKRWRSVGEQTAKYSRCVPVRARLSRTTSPTLAVPCNWGENKDRNYMFIFDNNFNLLCSPSRNKTPTKVAEKPSHWDWKFYYYKMNLMDLPV